MRTQRLNYRMKKLVRRRSQTPSCLKPITAMVVFAKPNGTLGPSSRIVGTSLEEILINSTKILKLTSAARKLYSEDGTLIENIDQLQPKEEVFVSLGEPFINPLKLIKDSLIIKEGSFWGLNGLYIPKTKRKTVSAIKGNKSQTVWRVLIFANNEYLINDAVEIISDLKNVEEFKAICSLKSNFNGQCKRLFTSSETEICDLKILLSEKSYVWYPNSDIPVLGPIWAAKTEDLNKNSVYEYFKHITASIKNILKESKYYLKELNAVESENSDLILPSYMKSFSKQELKFKREETERKIRKLERTLQKFNDKQKTIPEPPEKTVTEADKQLETKRVFNSDCGLKVQAYINGQNPNKKYSVFFNVFLAKRGVDDPKIHFNRFLDCLSENIYISKANDLSKGILVRRVFTVTGDEIFSLEQISYDQLICVSFGEDWIDLTTMCVCAMTHFMDRNLQSTFYDMENESKRLKEFKITEALNEKDIIYNLPVLQSKNSDIFLVTSLTVIEKPDNQCGNLCKIWDFTKEGKLILKRISCLCLTLIKSSAEPLDINKHFSRTTKKNADEKIEVNFYPVQLCAVKDSDPNQIWHFNKSGLLYNEAYADFFLTYLETDSQPKDSSYSSIINTPVIVAANRLPQDLEMYQRWAFKQESFENMNQWKLCDLPNPEWHKTTLTWPLKSNGDLNLKLKWPIEGLLIPCALPLTRGGSENEPRYPRKLMVLKNNDHTMTTRKLQTKLESPVIVVGPDLTKFSRKGKLHCDEETLSKLEFRLFLDACTCTFKLPSAARRLFDKNGNELATLDSLSNNDLVCLTAGEMWCSPDVSLSQIELRSYANNLAVDLKRLKYFLNMCHPNEECVLGLKCENLESTSTLEVQLITEQSKLVNKRIFDEDNRIQTPEPVSESLDDETANFKTCHEKKCEAAKLILRNKVNTEDDSADDVTKVPKKAPTKITACSNSQQFLYQSEKVLFRNTEFFRTCHERKCEAAKLILRNKVNADDVTKVQSKAPTKITACSNSQQFLYQSEKILLMMNQNFYLCADEVGKPVIIKKIEYERDRDRCKWVYHESGMFESMHFRGYVLSVRFIKMLPFQDKAPKIDYCGCDLILEKAVNTKYGKAHQIFRIDSRSGLFYPFQTNALDKSVTAAHIAGICTRFVCCRPISQPGSDLEMEKFNKSACLSCVNVMNGRVSISSIDTKNNKFSCYLLSGFKVLKKTIDLSSPKSEETFQNLTKTYNSIREKLKIKSCKNNFVESATHNFQILLHLNKNTRNVSSQKVTGKSISQIMEIATGLFHLQKPVQILYTSKGEEIFDDLTFRNVISQSANAEKSSDKFKSLTEDNVEEISSNFNVSLSEDQRFFIIEFMGKVPQYFYTLQINISQMNGVNIFHECHSSNDFVFLFNYEIFNNQINTELFFKDSDFEGEQTELSLNSSPKALIYLFSKMMPSLRLQMIAAKIKKNADSDEEFNVDLESIDGIVDFPFSDFVEKLQSNSFQIHSKTLILPLLSTDTFTPTEATIKIEIILKQDLEKMSTDADETLSVETASAINEPLLKLSDSLIELWASQGEPFCPMNDDPKNKNLILLQQLKLEIDRKNFLLRTTKGERLKKLNPGTLESTPSVKNPVKIKGNWQFPSLEEVKLTEEVKMLQDQLNQIKSLNGIKVSKPRALSRNLYKQKHMKNCLVHLSGERQSTAVSVWGESVWEILQNSATSLGIKKPLKYLFRENGQKVTKFEEISPGETLSASHESTYISQYESEKQCEIKANWGRARREFGENSTELNIQYRPNTLIDIDPFEPPDIMKVVSELPSKESKSIKVFENGQSFEGAENITGHSLSELLKKAEIILKLSLPVKCFYSLDGKRITSFREILHDDTLAASVSGKGLLTIDD